jgi:hypothetical protein
VPFSKYFLIPQLIWYGTRSPRDQGLAWDRFWASIQRTGPDGEVLWDAASADELDRVRAHALALDQLVAQGATATSMPEPLRKCIAAGIKPPRHFGEPQLAALFPPAYWETLESGPMTMHGVPLTAKGEFEPIPSFYAIVRRSPAG